MGVRATCRKLNGNNANALEMFGAQDLCVEDPFYKMHAKKMRDLADAGKLRGFYHNGQLVAAAVMFESKARSTVKGFTTDRLLSIEKYTLIVKRIALKPGINPKVVARSFNDCPMVCEAPMKDGVSLSLFKLLKLRRVTSKVSAFADLIGVFTNCPTTLTRMEANAQNLEAKRLILPNMNGGKFDVGNLANRLKASEEDWETHYSNYNSKKSWSALALYSYGGDENFVIKPKVMAKSWQAKNEEKLKWKLQPTSLYRRYHKYVAKMLRAIPGEKDRVRFMRLEPGGGELKRHTDKSDKSLGYKLGQLARLHVPIITNDRVIFTSWSLFELERTFHMGVGELWFLDIHKPHRAVNNGNDARIHLVVDVLVTKKLQDLLLGY